MKNVTEHVGVLTHCERMPSSRNGNPRYRLYVAGFNCRTAVDSSLGYSVTNYLGKTVRVTIGTHYGYPTLDSIKLED
jgi:hypothetical protein